MIVEALAKVVDGHDLTVAEATAVMADIMEDRASRLARQPWHDE